MNCMWSVAVAKAVLLRISLMRNGRCSADEPPISRFRANSSHHRAAGVDIAVSSAVGPAPDRQAVQPGPASRGSAPRSAVGTLGLEVSLRRFLQDQLIDGQFGHSSLQAAVFSFESLEPLSLIDLQPAVFISPTIVRLFSDPRVPTDLGHRLPFAQSDFSFTQLGKYLDPFKGARSGPRPSIACGILGNNAVQVLSFAQ